MKLRRRVLGCTMALLLLAALCEFGAYAGLWILGKRAPSRAVLLNTQQELADRVQSNKERKKPQLNGKEISHPFLGFIPKSGSGKRRPGTTTLNRDELADPRDPVFSPPPDTFVLAIAGGSVAAGMSMQGLKTIRKILERSPFLDGKQIHLLVLAYPSYHQPQQLIALSYALSLGAKIDAVWNLDGFNEVALHASGNGPQGSFFPYPQAWKQRISKRGASELDFGELNFIRQQRAALAARTLASPWASRWTAQALWALRDSRWRRAQAEAEQRVLESGEKRLSAGFSRIGGPQRPFANDTEMYAELADLWMRSSLQMHHLCEAQDILYLHFLQPNQYVEGSKPLSEQELEIAYREDHTYRPGVREGYPQLQARGQLMLEQGVRFHDLTDLFQEETRSVYSDACCHFLALGTQRIAKAMVEAQLSYSE